ncbi:MAG: hypothetical protein HQL18_01425 [Candidatus Omnitrophica bacterium]|nr:hypothetical protein [Candidatus Omnitrophota bacterium]
MIYVLPLLISLTQGYCLLRLLTEKARPRLLWMLFTGGILGLGLSAQLTFTSLLVFQQLNVPYVIGLNLLAAIALMILAAKRASTADPLFPWKQTDAKELIALAVLALLTVPVVIHATLYPYGGWDAWSCWNLKAQMIFVGGESWSNLFDPALWRSNTAYPLLLPLMNVWIWCFGTTPMPVTPLVLSCLITFLVMGLLFFSLKELTGRNRTLLAPAWFLSVFFFVQLASSQYSDLLVGTFLLLALAAFLLYDRRRETGFLQIALIALGLMSFTKSEGLVLSVITLACLAGALLIRKDDRTLLGRSLVPLAVTLGLAFLVSIVFQIVFGTNSHTLINGFSSIEKPTSLLRLQVIFVFLGKELISPKWNGLWLLAGAGLVFSGMKALRARLWLIPMLLVTYLAAVAGVYWMNTFFEIVWWLGTTLNRILFALTPTVIFWLFLAAL